MDASTRDAEVGVEWTRASASERCAPVQRKVRYLEVVIEYRGLEATRFGGAFFPDAVPYTCGEAARVFYWRSVLDAATPPASEWDHVCATPYRVQPAREGERVTPALTADDGRTVVVEGTVGGDSTEAELAAGVAPEVTVERVAGGEVVVAAAGDCYRVERGERHELPLGEQRVEPPDGERATATPVLTVRYPGERTFYHPAVDASYRLFPSFGLDLDNVSHTLNIEPGPNVGEDAVAAALGVDLDSRPYAERVLWQAFVHTAFGDDAAPTLAQFPGGLLAVWPGE
ncbi:hypothetical protein [Halobacterium sp. KA-6]|jgi:hypothetical protein|uniref:hypothetical protein n=1 Tax=Halobacterium sp. KA-6 TaxID=2896368 RepID=UPI001E609CE1|nr:hypothetical protein [Halobacterium sp. KA-6]MCD2202266.1 hypothetical protein [Halobacterium sp. KA-6]